MSEQVLLDACVEKSEAYLMRVYKAKWQLCCTAVLVLLLPLMAFASELSGVYIGGGKNFTVLLQILPAGQGKVVGRLRTMSIDDRGKLSVFDRPLSGAANGESFVGKLEASWDHGGDVAISGSVRGGNLFVSAANGLKVALRTGDEAQFHRLVEQLNKQSANIQQQAALIEVRRKSEDASNRTASQITRLRAMIDEFANQESRTVEVQALEAQRYGHFTEKMRTKLSQLQTVTEPTGGAEGKRSSLNADIYHLSIDASHIKITVQNALGSFENQAQLLLKGVGEAQTACQHKLGPSVDFSKLREECSLVSEAATKLTQTSKGVRDRYEILEKDWLRNRSEQVALLKQAESFKWRYSINR